MTAFIVVDHPEQWPLQFPGAEVISATHICATSG